jgi:hypothetical protein
MKARASAPVFGYSTLLEAIMARFNQILRTLRKQRAAARATIDRLDRAIEALAELGGKAPGRRGGPRHMSKAARKRIADAQRARWARVRGKSKAGVPQKPRRHISAAGRKRIADAQRARWARVRAAKKEEQKSA